MAPKNTTSPDVPNGNSMAEMSAVEYMLFGSSRLLWIGVGAVLIPLVLLLTLQYRWLTDLEQSSAIARRTSLENYLKAVTKETHYFYIKTAERALNMPQVVFTENRIEKAAHFFKIKEVVGADTLFIVTFTPESRLYVFDPKTTAMVVPEKSAQTVAIWAAASPWSYLKKTEAEKPKKPPVEKPVKKAEAPKTEDKVKAVEKEKPKPKAPAKKKVETKTAAKPKK